MPNVQDIEVDELDLVIDENESVEDTQHTDGEGESEDAELNLNDDTQVDKLTPAQQNAKRQEEAWLNKVVTGAAEVSEAPKWLHNRLNTRLETLEEAPQTEDVVRKVLNQELQAQEFKTLQSQIPKLSSLQAKELQDRFSELKPLGNVKALRTALDLMGLSQKVTDAEKRGIAKGRQSLPKSGHPSIKESSKAVGGVPMDIVSDNAKWNDMIRNGAN